jgi:hypothetical protein
MDVTDLRSAFLGAESLNQRIRNFRDGRLGQVLSGESPISTFSAPTFIAHVLPVGLAFASTDLDPRRIDSKWMILNREGELFELVYGVAERPNLDGLLLYSPNYDERFHASPSYIQIFRNGGIEFAQAHYTFEGDQIVAARSINGDHTEAQLLDEVQNARNFRREMGIGGPMILSVALLRVRGLRFGVERLRFPTGRSFDRDVVILPDVLIEEDSDLHSSMRPVFDSLWQAAGSKGSPSYTPEGLYSRKKIR